MTYKEVGKLTLRTFNRLYQHYKNDFDLEMKLKQANVTYKELEERQLANEEWF